MSNKRVFISFAMEDRWARENLVGQARNNRSPFEFVDMSVKQPWSNAWKTQCRTRIKGCHGVIALISKNTMNAEGARWEIKCAIEEGIPIIGVYTQRANPGTPPPELKGKRVIYWTWEGIANFINRI